MKQLSAVALLFVIFLGSLFVYVAEDIPAFGDPNSAPNRYVKLFEIDAAGLEGDLEQGVLPASLVDNLEDEIEERGFPLPSGVARVSGKGEGEGEGEEAEGAWEAVIVPAETEQHFYPKEQKYYFIEKKGEKLWVYRYAPVKRYMEEGPNETNVPNMVTYILADYRGYDTLGETTVIFTAGVAVMLLLRRREKRPREK